MQMQLSLNEVGVLILGASTFSFSAIHEFYKSVKESDPVRILDHEGISLQDPMAIDYMLSRLTDECVTSHCTITFAFVGPTRDSEGVINLLTGFANTILSYRGGFLVVSTGSVAQWKEFSRVRAASNYKTVRKAVGGYIKNTLVDKIESLDHNQ